MYEFGNAHTNASLPAEPAQRGIQVDPEIRAGGGGSRWQRSDHQRAALRQSSESLPHQVPQPAADPVPDDRVADRLTHDKAHPGRHWPSPGGRALSPIGIVHGVVPGGGRHQGMHHQPGPTSTTSPANHRPELLATGEPGGRGEHGFAQDQADSSARPLRRRAARMARPARVRMRSRNPWVLARRRLLGWKVRLPLLTVVLPASDTN